MNTNRALTFTSLAALAACLLMAAPASAQDATNCQPGDLFCAELRIGPGRAGIRIGGGTPAPPPPPVVVQPPQPPTVIVQPAPPPMPPQPPTVIVQPAYPPVYQPQPVYQPPPPTYVVQQPVAQPVQRDRYPFSSMGIHLNLAGIASDSVGMGGAGLALRLRPHPHISLDIGGAVYGGQDYNGLDRTEVPIHVTGRVYFNPQHRFQFYGLLQLGASISHAEGFNVHTRNFVSRDYAHLGAAAGFGAEWRINRWFALNLDGRGFLRHRVDESNQPEFTELTDDGWQSTDFSGGFQGEFGATFYWGM